MSPDSLTVGGDCRQGDENRMQINVNLDRIKGNAESLYNILTVGRAVGLREGCPVGFGCVKLQ